MICEHGVAALVETVRIAYPKLGWKIVGNDFDNAVLITTVGKKRISFFSETFTAGHVQCGGLN